MQLHSYLCTHMHIYFTIVHAPLTTNRGPVRAIFIFP